MLGVLPTVASADHHESARFSIGVGIGFRGGYYDYGRRYDCYGPRVSYGVSAYVPAPVYCPPPVVYEAPATVYCPPPAVVYAPPVYSTVVVPSPYVRVGVPYYSHPRYYYGR